MNEEEVISNYNSESVLDNPFRTPDIPMFSVDWHPQDTDIILTAGGIQSEGQLLLWQLDNDRIDNPIISLGDYEDAVNQAEFSPDGRWIASIDNETLQIWQYSTSELILTIPFIGATSIAWHPDSTRLCVGSRTGELQEFQFTSSMELINIRNLITSDELP